MMIFYCFREKPTLATVIWNFSGNTKCLGSLSSKKISFENKNQILRKTPVHGVYFNKGADIDFFVERL